MRKDKAEKHEVNELVAKCDRLTVPIVNGSSITSKIKRGKERGKELIKRGKLALFIYQNTESSTIMTTKPMANPIVPRFE